MPFSMSLPKIGSRRSVNQAPPLWIPTIAVFAVIMGLICSVSISNRASGLGRFMMMLFAHFMCNRIKVRL